MSRSVTLRKIAHALSSPSRFKHAVAVVLLPRLRRLFILLLPDNLAQRLAQIEADQAEARFNLLKLEARTHLVRVGRMESAQRDAEPAQCAILVDVRITQIAMRERGIPRYAAALALALPKHLPGADISYLVDPDMPMPDALDALKKLGRIVEGPAAIPKLPRLTHYLQTCVFELHKNADELFPLELAHFRPRLSAVVYDVIPWLYPQQYLSDPYLARRYDYQLNLLPYLDRLFAISESAREDVIRAAHLEAGRVQNIYGGIDDGRWDNLGAAAPQPLDSPLGSPLAIVNDAGQALEVRRPYWLYVGGADFRKNVAGLIRAYARMYHELSDAPALVIACSLSVPQQKEYLGLAESLGLTPQRDVVVTGYISDATLAHCYRNAFATVFPSLYEGLGLPVLESYHFGVPAIASNCSSLKEITDPACQFDPSDEADIARAMLDLHRHPDLRAQSLAFGSHILTQCNWQQAAGKVADYLRNHGVGCAAG